MQKKVIALAVAGMISGVAFAQTNVTVYGVADAYYAYSKGDNATFSGINSGGLSGGRVGFKGEEALGNGLKAVFTYEFGSINIDQNAGIAGTRQSFVGLASDKMGSLTMGRQYAPSFLFLGGTSSNEVTVVNPSNYFVPAFATMQTGRGARWNNSVAYHSPVFAGFDARVIYGFGEQSTAANDTSDLGQIGVGARYANGPLYLTALYQAVQENDATAAVEKNTAWAVGGNFDFKVVKVFANYIQEKLQPAATELKKKYWSAGVSVPVGKIGSVNAEFAQYKVTDLTDVKARGLGIGYNHFFSKRTTGYVNLSRINNKDGAAFGGQAATGNGSASISGSGNTVATLGENNTNFAVGVRHVF